MIALPLVRPLAAPLAFSLAGRASAPLTLPGDYPRGPGVAVFETTTGDPLAASVVTSEGYWQFVRPDGSLSGSIANGSYTSAGGEIVGGLLRKVKLR